MISFLAARMAIFKDIGVILRGLSKTLIKEYLLAYSSIIFLVLSVLDPFTSIISDSSHEKSCFNNDSIQSPMYFSSLNNGQITVILILLLVCVKLIKYLYIRLIIFTICD